MQSEDLFYVRLSRNFSGIKAAAVEDRAKIENFISLSRKMEIAKRNFQSR